MDKPTIKVLIFDLGGVVAHGGYLPFIKEYCLKCLTPEGKQKIDQLERRVNLGEITETEFYEAIKQVFDVDMSPQQMHQIIIDRMKLDKDLVNFIPTIEKGKVVLFSNSIGNMAAEVIKHEGLDNTKFFDEVFFSNTMHLAKPDKEAYEYVVKNLHVQPQEALMIDDRPQNIEQARAVGMHGIVYTDTAQLKKDLQQYNLV